MTDVTEVIFIQGAGAGAHDEDAKLAASLSRELGDGFTVDFPRMPTEDDPEIEPWRAAIGAAVDRADAPVVLVGHSFGGYILMSYLATTPDQPRISAAFVIAAPYPGGDPDWTFDGFELPDDLATRMHAPVTFYAADDDEVVPFAHRDLYAAAIPGSTARNVSGGHQLGGDLRVVAADIRSAVAERR